MRVPIEKNVVAARTVKGWVANCENEGICDDLMACACALYEGLPLTDRTVDLLEQFCVGMPVAEAEIVLTAIGRAPMVFGDDDPMVQLNIKIRDSLDTRLDVFCAARKIKKRDAVAAAINEYLKRNDH